MEAKSAEVSRSQYGKKGTENFAKELATNIVLHYSSCATDDTAWSQLA